MLILSLVSTVVHAAEEEVDYDSDDSRGPYEFQFRVDDPETYNKYEVPQTFNLPEKLLSQSKSKFKVLSPIPIPNSKVQV